MSNISNNTTTSTSALNSRNSTPTVGWDPAIIGTIAPSGSVLSVGNSTGNSAWSTNISLKSDITDFCELVLSALGQDITFEDFEKMSKDQRKSLLRDIKINRVLKGE